MSGELTTTVLTAEQELHERYIRVADQLSDVSIAAVYQQADQGENVASTLWCDRINFADAPGLLACYAVIVRPALDAPYKFHLARLLRIHDSDGDILRVFRESTDRPTMLDSSQHLLEDFEGYIDAHTNSGVRNCTQKIGELDLARMDEYGFDDETIGYWAYFTLPTPASEDLDSQASAPKTWYGI